MLGSIKSLIFGVKTSHAELDNIMQERNIEDFFNQLISQSGSYDIASAEFKRIIADDEELNQEYIQWCEAQGLSPREGFDAFCNEYRSGMDSIWDTLSDYDE